MRLLFVATFACASLALAQEASVSAPGPQAPTERGAVALVSAPQLGHLAVDGRVRLMPRVDAQLGGWNLFDDTVADSFVRGAWLGVGIRALEADGVTIDVTARALMGHEAQTDETVGGLWLGGTSTIRALRWFSVRPAFDATWLGDLGQARLLSEFRFTAGDWHLGVHGGAQLWFLRDEVTVAPLAELSMGWRHEFRRVAVDVSGVVAAARDPSGALGHPVLRELRSDFAPWGILRVGVEVL